MEISLRHVRAEEFKEFANTCEAAFGFDVSDEQLTRWSSLFTPERSLAAFDGDEMVGTAADFEFRLTVPGGSVPTAGVTAVGVLPTHRRRGILTRMMRMQIAEIQDRSEPIAALWASEGGIYGRYGYGLAALHSRIDIDRDRARFIGSPPPVGRTRFVPDDKAIEILAGVYERVCSETPGMFERTKKWWEVHRLSDPEDERRGGGPMFKVVWENEGRPEAYALYRIHAEWDTEPLGYVRVLETMGTSALAIREMWRFIIGIDLVARIKAFHEPALHPLTFMLAEPRRLRARISDSLWIRIINVKDALQSRSYAQDGSMVLEVADSIIESNIGKWRLTVNGSRASVDATNAEPDLRLTIGALSSVYLGGFSFAQLSLGGAIEEVKAGAIARADDLFRTRQQPWCPEIF
jgi:predicted acetyltransferase